MKSSNLVFKELESTYKRLYNYELIREKALQGPRVTTLLSSFEKIAKGDAQVPAIKVKAASEFLNKAPELQKYHEILQKNFGTFMEHLCASIPYSLEEIVRVGVAIDKLARVKSIAGSDKFSFYETSSADGTAARTLAEFASGTITTLTDSPNKANQDEFRKLCTHNFSTFHLGPFVDITPSYLRDNYPHLSDGFDVIWENTTFQMYGNYRDEQIAYVSRLLKDDGLIIFFEKMNHPNQHEYNAREEVKDRSFKLQYFEPSEISVKKKEILLEMENGQVTLSEFCEALKTHFQEAHLIWNSGNFYQIVASNSRVMLQRFLSFLSDPYVPREFQGEKPGVLFGL